MNLSYPYGEVLHW